MPTHVRRIITAAVGLLALVAIWRKRPAGKPSPGGRWEPADH